MANAVPGPQKAGAKSLRLSTARQQTLSKSQNPEPETGSNLLDTRTRLSITAKGIAGANHHQAQKPEASAGLFPPTLFAGLGRNHREQNGVLLV